MKAIVSILLMALITVSLAASSVVINAGSLICVNDASVIIDNGAGSLTINQPNGFVSDNVGPVPINTPTAFDGPEGSFDALTVTPAANLGTVQIINYSGQRHPGATINKIKRWWNMIIPSTATSTITFRVRTGNDCTGYTLATLSPFELSAGSWIKMTTAAPTVVTDGQYSSLTFTGVNFAAKKGDHIVTLGNQNNDTLPVELSSFTAVVTPQSYVRLEWVTQSETGVLGFNVYRNMVENINNAIMVSPMIPATNTSVETSYSYTDAEVPGEGNYYYWLQNKDINGMFEYHGPIVVRLENNSDQPPLIPLETHLNKPYPNPFNPSVTIGYGLAKAEQVQIRIYNIKGQIIRTLLNAAKNPGEMRLTWDGTNDNGAGLTSGVYYVKMTAGKYSSTQKIVLMK